MVRRRLAPTLTGARLCFAQCIRVLGGKLKLPLPVFLTICSGLALTAALGLASIGTGGVAAGPPAGIPSPEASPTEAPSPGGKIALTELSTGFNDPVGIDHYAPTNQVVMSVYTGTGGVPHNFELVSGDGQTRTPFSSISGLTDEVKIATVRDRRGGFSPGELFVGTGKPGEVARISPDGSMIQNPWVTLPDEDGLLRGSLHVDRTGVFGGDLIVVTTTGGVWRVNSSGSARLLKDLGTHLEGVTTVPNEDRYGPWAGKILAGAEDQGRIYAVDPEGNEESAAAGADDCLAEDGCFELGIKPEDIDIIPANENFFGVDFGSRTLWGATPDQFADMVGDVLIAQEDQGILWHVRWNGTSFDKEELTRVELWEHVTFSSAGIAEIPVLPPTTTDGNGLSPVLLATAGLLAVLLAGGGTVVWAQRRRQAAAGAGIALRQPAGRDSAIPVFAGTGPLGDPLKAEAWLDVVAPENFGTFALGEDPVTVGFTGDCTICLPEGADQIGTRLRVWKREGVYMLHNLSRLGKVAVAGKPATWAILEDGDVIELGASRLVFRTSEPAS
jgi:hypothetical protein